MNTLLLMMLLAGDPATCPMHAQHTAIDQRGDKVMGFSHHKTRHSFRLFADGGAVEVRANDAADAENVAAIRAHLKEIASEFAKGDFAGPREIHGRVPDGAEAMKALGAAIVYRYEELDRGARVRLVTKDARGVEAVHAFLRFQISDHRTGDSGKVE
jgi:hypothetical protein